MPSDRIMSVFYSHSTKNNQSYETYLKISEKLKDTIIDVSIYSNNYIELSLNKIINSVEIDKNNNQVQDTEQVLESLSETKQ